MSDYSTKNIEDVEIGDEVIAYDNEHNQFVVKTVYGTYIHHNT